MGRTISRQMVLSCITNLEKYEPEKKPENKLKSRVPLWPLLQLLPSGSCLGFPRLYPVTWKCKPNKPFLTKLPLVRVFCQRSKMKLGQNICCLGESVA